MSAATESERSSTHAHTLAYTRTHTYIPTRTHARTHTTTLGRSFIFYFNSLLRQCEMRRDPGTLSLACRRHRHPPLSTRVRVRSRERETRYLISTLPPLSRRRRSPSCFPYVILTRLLSRAARRCHPFGCVFVAIRTDARIHARTRTHIRDENILRRTTP